jgi:hypothetical protein
MCFLMFLPCLKLALETFGKTSSLAFQKSDNDGRSSKFLLASKQGEKRFGTHLFPSLVSLGNRGSCAALLIGTAKQVRRKHSALFRPDRFADRFSFLKCTLKLLAVKPLKPQGGT